MENYIVSARKYRPTTFESVVGQQALTQTLRNAIRSNRLAHAYLFCGPRGVGKTTCARIFAKTINCLTPTAEHEACNQCESCTAFNEQRSYNIHELDAASNNSVDDIRSLIDQVRIPPQIGKYSVYIIDEVHMLSQGAFNALLKTLEEPPSYAIFILATTEKHKILPTILSRCQVYDFTRITVADTIRHLQYVAQQEGITVGEQALNVVAQKADGGMRDALSIFDQLVAFCGKEISYEQAIEVLNVLNSDYYFRMVDAALQAAVGDALLLLNEVLQKGFDAGHFITGLAQHLRDVLVSKDAATAQLLETSDAIRQQYQQQATRCNARWIFNALDIVNTCDVQFRTAKNKRLTVELALVKLCRLVEAPVTNNQAPIANSPSPIANNPSPITNSPSPITNRQSPIANSQSPIAKKWSIIAAATASGRQVYYRDQETFFVGSMHAAAYWHTHAIFHLGGGVDVFYDGAYVPRDTHFQKTNLAAAKAGDCWRIGVSLQPTFVVGDFSLGLHLGAYLHDPVKELEPYSEAILSPTGRLDKPIFYAYDMLNAGSAGYPDGWMYTSVVLRYHLPWHIFLQAMMKSHLTKVEFVSLGIGFYY